MLSTMLPIEEMCLQLNDLSAMMLMWIVYHLMYVKHAVKNMYGVYTFTQTGWTPLMKASFEGHTDIMRLLIEAKAQINKQKEV